jgi:hypothetical protein
MEENNIPPADLPDVSKNFSVSGQYKAPSYLTPTLLGGLLLGLLSSIPVVSYVNLICCAWVILGGFVAAFLWAKDGGRLDKSTASYIGFLAGLWGAVIATSISSVMWMIQKDKVISQIYSQMQMTGSSMPEGTMDMLVKMMESPLLIIAITFVFWLVINSIFATLGGFLCFLIVKKGNNAREAF